MVFEALVKHSRWNTDKTEDGDRNPNQLIAESSEMT